MFTSKNDRIAEIETRLEELERDEQYWQGFQFDIPYRAQGLTLPTGADPCSLRQQRTTAESMYRQSQREFQAIAEERSELKAELDRLRNNDSLPDHAMVWTGGESVLLAFLDSLHRKSLIHTPPEQAAKHFQLGRSDTHAPPEGRIAVKPNIVVWAIFRVVLDEYDVLSLNGTEHDVCQRHFMSTKRNPIQGPAAQRGDREHYRDKVRRSLSEALKQGQAAV